MPALVWKDRYQTWKQGKVEVRVKLSSLFGGGVLEVRGGGLITGNRR